MRALALVLVASVALADDHRGRFDRFCSRSAQGRTDRGFDCQDFAFFEAFPANGAGTFGPCSTTPPTGAKGEAMTFARTGTATCTKTLTDGGLTNTGIANGDLVVMSSGVPRVEYDAQGALGLLVESSRVNSIPRSQEIDNAAWAKTGTVIAAPTVTADFATAPDGTLTADRVQVPACPTAGNESTVNIAYGATAAAWDHTFYVRGTSGAGSVSLAVFNSGSAGSARVTCNFVSGSWTRCELPYTHTTAAAAVYYVGCTRNAAIAGNVDTGAADFLLWGGQAELGAYATSYIPTGVSAVTRNAESSALTLSSSVGPSGCIAASATWPSPVVGAVNIASLGVAGAGNNMTLYRTSNTAAGYQIGVTTSAPAVSAMGTTTHRTVLADNSGTRTAYWDASPVAAPAASLSAGQSAVQIGAVSGGGTPIDGIVSRVQVDPVFARCTP